MDTGWREGDLWLSAARRVRMWWCVLTPSLADGAERNGDGPIATSQWSGYMRAGSGLGARYQGSSRLPT